jgi:hypothetical protein
MLEPILGSVSSERALIFILARDKSYATEIARYFGTDLYAIQKQLDKLESGGVLVSQTAGRTRLYEFNPRYPFLKELKGLLEKALSFYPEKERDSLLIKDEDHGEEESPSEKDPGNDTRQARDFHPDSFEVEWD